MISGLKLIVLIAGACTHSFQILLADVPLSSPLPTVACTDIILWYIRLISTGIIYGLPLVVSVCIVQNRTRPARKSLDEVIMCYSA